MTTANLAHQARNLSTEDKATFFESDAFFIALGGAHFALGVGAEAFSQIGTIHALFTALLGIYIIVMKRTPVNLLCYAGYVVGMEVVWRMTSASVFWESGKYLVSFALLFALLSERKPKVDLPPVLYFLALLPALPAVFMKPFVDARDDISFNYSGPFLLTIAMIVFANIRLSENDILRMMKYMVAGILAVSGSIVYHLSTAPTIYFRDDSNDLFSGGFAPNQVTTILGFGMVLAFGLASSNRVSKPLQLVLFGLTGIWAQQALLTFSRSGLAIAVGTVVILAVLLLRIQSARNTVVALIVLVPLLATYYLIPRLNNYTGGGLETRFTDTTASGRGILMEADIYAFREAPLLGVGVSYSREYHDMFYVKASQPHNEFTRMLAEHGVFGIVSMGILVMYLGGHWLKRKTPLQFAIYTSLLAWGFVTLGINGFRLAAPAFAIALVVLGSKELAVGKDP